MTQHDSAKAKPRRIVTKIVLSYVVEGEDEVEEKEYSLALSRDRHGATVDGVVWSPGLMKKLAYLDGRGPDHAKPAPRRPARPEDGWRTGGRPGKGTEAVTADGDSNLQRDATMAASMQNGDDGDCLWLHDQSCIWISLCDDPWPH